MTTTPGKVANGSHKRDQGSCRSPANTAPAIAAKDTYDFLGTPEGELALAQATIYLALAPKSNAAYVAFGQAQRAAEESGSLLPPKHILNAPTKLMKQEGYGRGYAYDLLAECTHHLVEHGAQFITGATDRGNFPMAANFARAGFPVVRERINFHPARRAS